MEISISITMNQEDQWFKIDLIVWKFDVDDEWYINKVLV